MSFILFCEKAISKNKHFICHFHHQTDDQILLLQNCWGELLCLCCCWHSLHCDNQIKLCYGRRLGIEQAQLIGLGDIMQRLIDFSSQLRNLELDSHEFVAMKVLMLLTPGTWAQPKFCLVYGHFYIVMLV